jgi:hypothetical protein
MQAFARISFFCPFLARQKGTQKGQIALKPPLERCADLKLRGAVAEVRANCCAYAASSTSKWAIRSFFCMLVVPETEKQAMFFVPL